MPISAIRTADRAAAHPAGKETFAETRQAGFRSEEEHVRLARCGVPLSLLTLAADRAEEHGSNLRAELFALGFSRSRFWQMLAEDLDLVFLEDLEGASLVQDAALLTTEAVRVANALLVGVDGHLVLVTAPSAREVPALKARLRETPQLAAAMRIATPETIRAFIAARRHAALHHYTLRRLSHVLPKLSAERQAPRGARGMTALLAAYGALCLLSLEMGVTLFGLASTLLFLNCGLWKLAAAFRPLRRLRLEPVWDRQLPTYSILVPLYREADVVASLIRHLADIDYPVSKLQIVIILEADDIATREAALRFATGPQFEILTVPPGGPRTKPKALTYALNFVRADYVVVFDAEDRPEPGQLRKAVAAFREHPEIGCVQARLAPDNEDSWLARMFTIEYAANFEVVLPALAEWGAPLPLGGTSNHFPRAVLEKVAAWDPFNVTEDADLGIRLARFGYRSLTILSRTYEEAPVTLRQWLPQRRRWIKGWIQTVAPCLARGMPKGLRLSLRERLAVHGILSAGVLGLLLYPASLYVLAAAAIAFMNDSWPEEALLRILLCINIVNFLAVIVAAVVSTVRGVLAVRRPRLLLLIPLLPVYWALMSFAAWQALVQYYRSRFTWEKTTHGLAKARRTPRADSSALPSL